MTDAPNLCPTCRTVITPKEAKEYQALQARIDELEAELAAKTLAELPAHMGMNDYDAQVRIADQSIGEEMTCPPCNNNCRQGRDCPNKPKAPDFWAIGFWVYAIGCTAYTAAVFVVAYVTYHLP